MMLYKTFSPPPLSFYKLKILYANLNSTKEGLKTSPILMFVKTSFLKFFGIHLLPPWLEQIVKIVDCSSFNDILVHWIFFIATSNNTYL